MMDVEEIKENLCYNDLRNPDRTIDDETAKEIAKDSSECYCDNCFTGRTELAEELLKRHYYYLDLKKQNMVVNQRLQYHFASPSTGGWNIPKNMPFMNEFLNEVEMLTEIGDGLTSER